MNYSLNHNSWFSKEPVNISLPDDWDVTYCGMAADLMPVLSAKQLEDVISSPVGSQTIEELAKGKKDVAIIFDDLSRGTPCEDIAKIILKKLHSAGIKKEQIRFICALGTHGALTRIDFEKKLGKDIIKDYAVFNHNPFVSLRYLGDTPGGVPVHINEELMRCDLKIGIGSISPHPVNGFGGGGKLVMIGCAGIKTIEALHAASAKCCTEKNLSFVQRLGSLRLDGMRKEIEAGVKMVGFDFKVDAILNSNCDIIGITAGDPVKEYYEGVKISKQMNFSDSDAKDMDVVIANANVKANEATIAIVVAVQRLKKQGGTVVMVDHTPLGQVYHQMSGPFGYYTGGSDHKGIRDWCPGVNKIVYFTPNPDKTSALSFCDPKKVVYAETWDEVMAELSDYKQGTKAAILSDSTIIAFDK